MNPEAGGGRGRRLGPDLAAALRSRGVETAILVATGPDEALAMARAAVADGADSLVAAGGDGTVHLALQAVAGTRTPLGIVALGTGNDNAAGLGLPVKNVEAAADVIAAHNVRSIDVASVTTADGEQRWFLGVLSAGFDSLVTERANTMTWPKGQARYVRALVAELRAFRPVRFDIDVDGESMSDGGMFASIGNGTRYGGGMKVCAGARLDDGLLTMTWIHRLPRWELVRTFPKVFAGTHLSHPGVTQHVGRRIRVEALGQLAYADGERVGPLPIDVEVHPFGVNVLLQAGATLGQPVAEPDSS
jgi:diacylglycerol kinase (ATP)